MTKATQALQEEHRWIHELIDCMQALVGNYRTTGDFDAKAAGQLQSLFEHFVDEQHQEKEETALFPRLLERVEALRDDHAKEREHLERMRFSLFNAALGDPAGRDQFIDEAQKYADLQRRHMAKESLGLLPLAEHLLTAEDDEYLLAEFLRRETRGYEHDEVRAKIDVLRRHFEVTLQEQGGAN